MRSDSAASRVKAIREKTGLSRTKFCKKFELPYRTVENWERGIACPPEYVVTMLEKVVKSEEQLR